MNVVIYARYSSHNQQETSIEGQLKVCHEFCERNNYTVIHEYIDRAISGRTDNRPDFLQMIQDSASRHFDFIIVYQLDRFSRNRYDSAHYKNKLKNTEFGFYPLARISTRTPAVFLWKAYLKVWLNIIPLNCHKR